jgi:hypothetical protein
VLNQLIFTRGLFLAAAFGGAFSSTDGVNWAYVGAPASFQTLGAGDRFLLGVGADGVLYEGDYLPQLLGQPRRLANGQLEWSVSGAPGLNYQIEYSDDLRTWQTLTTVSNAPVPFSFTDPGAVNHASRFYRSSTP